MAATVHKPAAIVVAQKGRGEGEGVRARVRVRMRMRVRMRVTVRVKFRLTGSNRCSSERTRSTACKQ